jgi:AcrR family transcriptional regulator
MTPVAIATNPQERILQAATDLFSQVGFNGASTRDIARLAAVNDATIYRHFASKKNLFVTVLEAELQKLRVRPDLLVQVANAEDLRSALGVIFELLTDALAAQPRLLRLLQFSVLEFKSDLQPLYQRYLGELLEGAATYLRSWRERGALRCEDPRAMVVAFAVTVVGMQTLFPIFGAEQLSMRSGQDSAAECADLWHAVLAGTHRVQ